MNIRNFGRGMRFFRLAIAAVSAIAFFGIAGAQEKEKTGKVQQGLVGGTVVSAEMREQYGLLTFEQELQCLAAQEQLGNHCRSLCRQPRSE